MGFIDKILDTMNLNPDDEDDFDNDDYYFDDEPEETHKSRFSKKETDEGSVSKKESAPKEKAVKPQSKITPISKSSRKQGAASMEVCVIKPSSIEDEIEITETLLNGRTVVINMEGLNVDTASCRSSAVAPQPAGREPPKYLFTMAVVRLTRLPRSLARSVLMRPMRASLEKLPSLPKGNSRSRK